MSPLTELIQDIRFTMLTTRAPSGQLRSRPITTQNRPSDDGKVLWFFVEAGSEMVSDIEGSAQVNLAYAAPDRNRYVSVVGSARLVNDLQRKKELWSDEAQHWFPLGVSDPSLALLAVDVASAEAWDHSQRKMLPVG